MTVNASQRFTRSRPCPVCGGYERAPRGQGQRCWGFLSDDGKWAHCVREEMAAGLSLNPNSDTYAHKLADSCVCGVRHDPKPARQPPRWAKPRPPPSPRSDAQDRKLVKTYDYRDEEGRLLFQALRFRPKGFALRRPDGKGDWIWNV